MPEPSDLGKAAVPIANDLRPYRRIAVEEGYISPGVLAENSRVNDAPTPLVEATGPAAFLAKALIDVGPGRIAAMDRDGIDLQLLLQCSPGVQVFEQSTAVALAVDANDYIADRIAAFPDRLRSLATIAPQAPKAAARELERSMAKRGFHGAVINSHTNGEYLDLPKYWPIFEAAEALDAAIYLHPREPAGGMGAILSTPVVAGAAWGYGVEVGTHVLKLIAAGVFDRFPRLRLVIGHMGESLPFWLPRIDRHYKGIGNFGGAPNMELKPSEYLRRNIWVTTSGMNWRAPLQLALDVLGQDRVLFASDYPFENQSEAVAGAEDLPLAPTAKRALFEDNAVRVFNL
jgi:5-carboxyvanillate decarboxylase